jgi:3-(3-hydroxy-phenyl)propionate hydroxylase
VNSGRLSRPCVYEVADGAPGLPAGARPGAVAPDAPLGNGWLSEALGRGFALLCLNVAGPEGVAVLVPKVTDVLAKRYLGEAGKATYLIRPDQVVAARWDRAVTADEVAAAMQAVLA